MNKDLLLLKFLSKLDKSCYHDFFRLISSSEKLDVENLGITNFLSENCLINGFGL